MSQQKSVNSTSEFLARIQTSVNTVSARVDTVSATSTNPQQFSTRYVGTQENDMPMFRTMRGRTGPTTVQQFDKLGSYEMWGHNGTEYASGCGIKASADETWTTGAKGSFLEFFTTPNGTLNQQQSMTITSGGGVIIGQNSTLATSATDGFLYIPSVGGSPVGVSTPQTHVGKSPLCFNPASRTLYIHDGITWRSTVLS